MSVYIYFCGCCCCCCYCFSLPIYLRYIGCRYTRSLEKKKKKKIWYVDVKQKSRTIRLLSRRGWAVAAAALTHLMRKYRPTKWTLTIVSVCVFFRSVFAYLFACLLAWLLIINLFLVCCVCVPVRWCEYSKSKCKMLCHFYLEIFGILLLLLFID